VLIEHVAPLRAVTVAAMEHLDLISEEGKISTQAIRKRTLSACTLDASGKRGSPCLLLGTTAHGVGDKVEAAYRRSDMFEKRQRLMEAWSTLCAAPQQAAGNVTRLRSDRA
jgi:hypothetical protein